MNFKENESLSKLRGGYYTSPEIAQFLLKWVLNSSPQNILEPSCGDGVFFRCLSSLEHKSLKSVLGFEIEAGEAAKANETLTKLAKLDGEIINRDFLSWAYSQLDSETQFDAIVGNPPFIRYQYLEKELQTISQKIFKYFYLNFTKHTNVWVAFVVASLALLKPSGRLAMIIPSELLHVLYAESLRGYLAESCSKILLFDPQELLFDNTLQGALLLLAEKKASPESKSHGISIIQTTNRDFLSANPEDYFQKAEYANGETVKGKWMLGFLSEAERMVLQTARQNALVSRFNDIAEVAVGIVTGANNYFLVSDAVVNDYSLSDWSYPMFGRSNHVPGIVYDQRTLEDNRQKGNPTNFLWFQNESMEVLPERVQEYIKLGEAQSLHTRYKCRIRKPWYAVPSVYATSVAMLKRCHDYPRLILNNIQAFTTDTAYRIKLKSLDAPSLVYSFVNSLTALSAELEGRHYGGGVLELVPSEIRNVLIPNFRASETDIYNLDALIRGNEKSDTILARQDSIVLAQIGMTNQNIEEIHHALIKLRLRRQRISADIQEPEELETI